MDEQLTSLWGADTPAIVAPEQRPPRMPTRNRDPLVVTHPLVNPCVQVFGAGPANTQCKTCQLFRRIYHHNKDYVKCELRPHTRGQGTDHRAKWPTCAKYVAQAPDA